MKFKFITDPLDQSDSVSFPNAFGGEVFASFLHSATQDLTWTFGSLPAPSSPTSANPVEIPSTPALVAEAVESLGAQSGPTSLTSMTTGGITINLLFDAAAMAAPASFRAGIQQAASLLTAAISDQITVNIKINYSGTGGGAAAGPDAGLYQGYSSVRTNLISHATAGDTSFNALPSGSSIQGQSSVAVWNAQLKLWGGLGANDTTTDDGSATFATDINPNLLVGVALHELTHAMGRVPYGSPYSSSPDIFDFFRFTSPGTRLFSGSNTAPAAYFSVDGGTTRLADYGMTSDSSDFLNSGVQGFNDPFNEFYGGSTLQALSAVDKAELDALGFHIASKGIVVTGTASRVIQGGGLVTLLSGPPTITDSASTTLSSATIKIANGSSNAIVGDLLYVNGVENGALGNGVAASWNASTCTLTLTGSATIATYDTLLSQVSYQDTGADSSTGNHPQRTVTWTLNDGTNTFFNTSQIGIERAPVATVTNVVLNSGLITVAASSLLTASDPDGDAIATYAFQDTGTGYFILNGVVKANNQEIDVTAGQLSQLSYQNAIGTDSLQVRVSDGTLWSAWQSFTVTGPVPTVIESFGSTSLVQVGSNYFLDPVGGGTGPELKYTGAIVVASQYAPWTPIGAEQVGSGYEVAWKNTVTGQFTVWATDSNGNYVSNPVPLVTATDTSLEAIETTFHQDLNGDGVIGVPSSAGSATVSAAQANGGSTAFDGTTLTLDTPAAFNGQIIGFAGDGILASSNRIDLRDVSFNSVHSSFDSSKGTLAVSDGTTTANLQFLGTYSQDNFKFTDDGHGGTVIYASSTPAQDAGTTNQFASTSQTANTAAPQDTFVFAPHFGQINIANFAPATDTIQFSKSVFANMDALIAAAHDDGSGNAVLTDAAHDTITIQHITTAQLLSHQSDFHFI